MDDTSAASESKWNLNGIYMTMRDFHSYNKT